MKPVDIVIVAIILLILGGAIWFLYRAKKKGVKCVGCPDGGKCNGGCSACAGCQKKES